MDRCRKLDDAKSGSCATSNSFSSSEKRGTKGKQRKAQSKISPQRGRKPSDFKTYQAERR